MSAEQTPVERVRYSLAQADKARKDAERYRRLKSNTLGSGFPKSARITKGNGWWKIWTFRHLFDPHVEEITLDQREIDMISGWFSKMEQDELKRAVAYEREALKEASKETKEA